MSGVAIVAQLLIEAEPVVARVGDRIRGGMLPQGVALPALLVREISVVERLKLRRVGKVRLTARIEVTVRAATYQDQKDVADLVVRALAGRTGDIGGGIGVSILNAGAGPDLIGEGGIFMQSNDFRVSFETDA